MKTLNSGAPRPNSAFTLVELLLVISVIAIMGALAISHFSNASQDTRRVVARQQQAALQSAVNAWVAGQVSGNNSVEEARTAYNTPTTSKGKLDLISAYLDDATYDHFDENTTSDTQLKTASMDNLSYYLQLPAWAAGSYPKVDLIKP
jgi:prepilin-type N-terminal cleavage/methylation domain-containing protein